MYNIYCNIYKVCHNEVEESTEKEILFKYPDVFVYFIFFIPI